MVACSQESQVVEEIENTTEYKVGEDNSHGKKEMIIECIEANITESIFHKISVYIFIYFNIFRRNSINCTIR